MFLVWTIHLTVTLFCAFPLWFLQLIQVTHEGAEDLRRCLMARVASRWWRLDLNLALYSSKTHDSSPAPPFLPPTYNRPWRTQGAGGSLKETGTSESQGRVNDKFWFGCVVLRSWRCWKDIETVGDIGWNPGAKSHSSHRFVSLPNQQMQDPGTRWHCQAWDCRTKVAAQMPAVAGQVTHVGEGAARRRQGVAGGGAGED